MEHRLRANIRKFYLFNILSSFVFYYAVDKVLMASRGLSVTDMVLVEVSYLVARLILEVPSGALADRWSRKYVLALNMVFFALNTFLWAIAPGLGVFILGSLIASIHSALKSGTDTSFLYDTLQQTGGSNDYARTQGNVIFWENLLSIVAGITGAMIADAFGLAAPLWVTLPFTVAAVITALTFTEPEIHRTTGEMGFWKHIGETGSYLLRHRSMIILMSLSVMLGATFFFTDEYGQLYFVGVGIPVFALGYLDAVGNGLEAITGKLTYRLERFGRKKVFASAIVLSAAGFCVSGITKTWLGVPFIFLPLLAFYLTHPLILADFYNELPSGQRATGASFLSLLHSLVTIPLAFGFGSVADHVSIAAPYLLLGVLVVAYFAFFIFSYNGKSANTPAEK